MIKSASFLGVKSSVLLLVIFISFSCNQQGKNQINIENNSVVERSSVDSISKKDPEGYYYFKENLIVGKYRLISILIAQQNNNLHFKSELTLVDSISQIEMSISSKLMEIKSDSVKITFKDGEIGEIIFRGKFLMNPIDNPKVIEKETVVLKGDFILNNQVKQTSFTYFAGD